MNTFSKSQISLGMDEADSPIEQSDDEIYDREDSDEGPVNILGNSLLLLINPIREPEECKEEGISHDSSDEEDILDDDPSSESRDSYSYRRTRAYCGDKESCKGEKESY